VLTRYATELDYRVTGVTVDRNKGQVELAVSHLGAPVTIAGTPGWKTGYTQAVNGFWSPQDIGWTRWRGTVKGASTPA